MRHDLGKQAPQDADAFVELKGTFVALYVTEGGTSVYAGPNVS